MICEAHILIIDDDERISALLKRYLIKMVFWYPPPKTPRMQGGCFKALSLI